MARGGHSTARIHDLRHSFAVRRLLRWHEQGVDVHSNARCRCGLRRCVTPVLAAAQPQLQPGSALLPNRDGQAM